MDAYLYKAAFLCSDCAKALMVSKPQPAHVDPNNESSYDSDEWPKGPYSDGGGEADCPQHCDHCQVFLENPLTRDGYDYVREQLDCATTPSAIVDQWATLYEIVKP